MIYVFIILSLIIIVAVLCGLLIPSESKPFASATTKYVSASYVKSGDNYKATVQFSKDLTGVSAAHIHRGDGGTIGQIIAWLATSQEWQDTQTTSDENSPCCNPQNNCTFQAPSGTINVFNVEDLAGKRIS